MSELQSRLCIHRIEYIFDSHALRPVLLNDFLQRGKDGMQLRGQAFATRDADGASVNVTELGAAAIDNAISGDLAAAIDAEYDHGLLTATRPARARIFLLSDEFRIRY